ncbi:MAG: hypothetical protein JKY74_08850 [Shewanella sp.]|nr:hypothetical protein [Shewanella sp.]
MGSQFTEMIGAKFIDGDNLHPKANIIKMAIKMCTLCIYTVKWR